MGFLNCVFFFGEPEKELNFPIWQTASHSCERETAAPWLPSILRVTPPKWFHFPTP